MLKLCDKFICKPLSVIFKSCLTQGIFPYEWKKANVVPIHKKTKNSVLKTTDLCLFSKSVAKFLERIIDNMMFQYFIKNNPTFVNQSGFKPCDSCSN